MLGVNFLNESMLLHIFILTKLPDLLNMSIDYSTCKFEARLQKNHFLRKNDSFYLYVSADKIIINTEPYAKKPWLVLELLPTTHVKWLWENKRNRSVDNNKLKGFIIETEGHMYEFNA